MGYGHEEKDELTSAQSAYKVTPGEDKDQDAYASTSETGTGHLLRNYTQIVPARCQCFSSRMRGIRRPLSFSGAAGPEASLIANTPSTGEYRSLPQHDILPWAQKAIRATMFSSWLNGLLVFVPVGLWAFLSDRAPLVVFVTNGIAIVPLSSLLTGATEMIAEDAGDTVGALLNITLGNLVELILFVALKHKQVHVVQASILGSMLVNLLPILGVALCVNGIRHEDPVMNVVETQLLSCLLFVSVFVLLIPAAFNSTIDEIKGADAAKLRMSRASALVVLLIYLLYFVHELRAHTPPSSYNPLLPEAADIERYSATLPRTVSLEPPALSSRTISFVDQGNGRQNQEMAGDEESHIELESIDTSSSSSSSEDEISESMRGRTAQNLGNYSSRSSSCDNVVCSRNRSLSRSTNASTGGRRSRNLSTISTDRQTLLRPGLTHLRISRGSGTSVSNSDPKHTIPRRSNGEKALSILVLMISSALMSMCAEFLVGTIDEVTHQGHLSEAFIGLIILPIVGNVAEFVTVVTVAHREKLDLAVAVAVGSSVQIALCVAPLTMIAAWIMARELSLSFSLFDAAALVGAAVLVNFFFLSDASSVLRMSRLKGALMCACYIIIG
ncbi:vacuolar calcium ion transporter [Colletotrichum tofieldiae]|uniref:Vacuolar calcium ion transporter n=1 Tax=Colletotrichum tofieldiae TaxID=708197 RepID=A0A166Q736_9PEZI|nr:vacuolar calcium ion transporter [Colletotrichum tofieldiae]